MTTPQATTPSHLRRSRILLTLYLITWTALTHWPKPPNLPEIPGGDKTIHALGYLIAAILLQNALARPLPARALAAIALIIFAALDEVTQPLVARSASPADWIADTFGIIIGSLIAKPTQSLLKVIKNKYL